MYGTWEEGASAGRVPLCHTGVSAGIWGWLASGRVQCSWQYTRGWFILDVVASFPLECVLTAAAPGVNFYNMGKAIRY